MSSPTRLSVREEITQLLGDVGSSDNVFSPEQINRAIQRHMRLIGNDVRQGPSWSTSMITCVVGTSDYALTTSVEYAQVLALKLQPNGLSMMQVTMEVLENMRQGVVIASGIPLYYALREGTDQTVNVRVHPKPNLAYTIDVLRSTIPPALTSDAMTIPFSENLVIALVYRVAAEFIGRATPDQLATISLNPGAEQDFREQAAIAIRREKERLHRLSATPYIARVNI